MSLYIYVDGSLTAAGVVGIDILTALKTMFCLIVLVRRITTTKTVISGELLASSCFSREVSVRLHQKGWQLSLC